MFHRDYDPAHVHVFYAGQAARFGVATDRLLTGSLPPRALRLYREWARQHRAELEANWARARLVSHWSRSSRWSSSDPWG